MLLAATEVLRASPRPSPAEVLDRLGGVLCRCTGYRKIVAAVLDAAGDAPQPLGMPPPGAAVGARLAKLDGALARLHGEHRLQVVSSRSSRDAPRPETIPYLAEITGADRPGVLARMVQFFSEREIPIEDFHATTSHAAHGETRVGSTHFTVGLPTSLSLATIRGEFMDVCDELNVDGVLAPIR